MPHLVILYTPNLDKPASGRRHSTWARLCRELCDAMLAVRDEADKQVFPTGGTRVLAYPAAHSAVVGRWSGRRPPPAWGATTPLST